MTLRPPADDPTPTDGLLPVPADAVSRAALTARVTMLSEARHPHLVPLAQVTSVDDGHLRVTHERGEVADLPSVLAARGHLSPAEAAAVGVNIAQALAVLHAAGHAHGPVGPADVVLRPAGTPALRPRVGLPPEEWTPAEDVRALAHLVDALLGSRPGPGAVPGQLDGDAVADPAGALRATLTEALGTDHRRRPEAGTLAALIDATCPPVPVRLPDPATLAGAALVGVLRTQSPTTDAAEPGRRFRAIRAAGARPQARALARSNARPRARSGAPSDAVHARPTRRTGAEQPPGRRGARPGRRAGTVSLRPALRPALVVVGVSLAVALTAGAVLELRDREAGAVGAVDHATATPGSTAHPTPGASVSSGQPQGESPAPAPVSPAPTSQPSRAPSASSEAPSPPSSGGDATRDRTRPGDAAVALTQLRLDLLARHEPDLGAVDLVGSPAHQADEVLVARLTEAGVRPQGPRATLHRDPETLETNIDPLRARVRLEYVVEAHDQVGADGTRTPVPESEPQTVTLELTWTQDGWRVSAVA